MRILSIHVGRMPYRETRWTKPVDLPVTTGPGEGTGCDFFCRLGNPPGSGDAGQPWTLR